METDATSRKITLALGRGGRMPGVLCIPHLECEEEKDTLIPTTASVYAVDLDPCEQLLACGTRDGMIHVFPYDEAHGSQPSRAETQLLHGRPILAVSFTDTGGLVSTDDSGQVLCWGMNQAASPTQWLDGGPAICALGIQAEGMVVGLGVDGRVLLWNSGSGEILQRLAGPPPASPYGVVRLANWVLDGHAIVAYPVHDGRLATIDISSPMVQTWPGHESVWYAGFQLGEDFITLGHHDGIAKVWRWTDQGPTCEMQLAAFPGAMNADVGDEPCPAYGVAVLAHGSAVRFGITRQSLQIDAALPGEDYRVMARPCERLIRRQYRGHIEQRAAQLTELITSSNSSGEEYCLDEAFAELEKLGWHRESLDLRVRHAGRTGNRIEELLALHQLVNKYRETAPDGTTTRVDRYIELLCEYGQIELAVETCDRMVEQIRGSSQAIATDGLRAAVQAFQEGRTVLRTQGDPLEYMDQARQVEAIVERPLKGWWEIHQSTGLLVPGARFGADKLAHELQTGGTVCATTAPRPVHRSMLCCQAMHVEEIGAVVFRTTSVHQSVPLQIALFTQDLPAGTEVKRSILLEFGRADEGGRSHRDNACLAEAASQLLDDATRRTLLAATDSWVHSTLRRMRGAAMASAYTFLGDSR